MWRGDEIGMEARLKVDLNEIRWRDERQLDGIESSGYEVVYTGFPAL